MAATGKTTPEHDARIASMSFGAVYPHYVTKVVRKGRTEQELKTVIGWLTGIEEAGLRQAIDDELSFCLLYTSPSPRDATLSRMPSSA